MEIKTYRNFPAPVSHSVLPNGLTVLTAHTGTATTVARLVFHVGSFDDDIPGMAHMIEHLLYTGPARDGAHPLVRHLLRQGVSADAAATSSFATEYELDGFKEQLPDMIMSLLKICFEWHITPEFVEKERRIIIREIPSVEPKGRFDEWRARNQYCHVSALHHTPCGTPESLEQITGNNLERFFKRWYIPSNAALMVSGGCRHEQVLSALAEFSDWPAAIPLLPERPLIEPMPRRATYTENDEAAGVILYFPAPKDAVLRAHLQVAIELLTYYPLGLLHQRLRFSEQKAYMISGSRYNGLLSRCEFVIDTDPCNFDYVVSACQTMLRAVQAGDYPKELYECVMAVARKYEVVAAEQGRLDNLEILGTLRGQWIERGTEEYPDILEILRQIKESDISAIVEEYLREDSCGYLYTVPGR